MTLTLVEFISLKKNLKDNTKINIISGSMEPWIKAGETILISPISLNQLKPLDIIVYWDEKRAVLICHIFSEIRGKLVICKPLISKIEDTPINPNFLLAIVETPKFKWYHKILLKIFH
jgi:signal peptidase I